MYAIFLHTHRYCKQSILFKIFKMKIIIDQSNFTFSPYLFRTKNRRKSRKTPVPIGRILGPHLPDLHGDIEDTPPPNWESWKKWFPKWDAFFQNRVLSKKEGEFSENRAMMVERIKRHQTPKNIRKREDHVKTRWKKPSTNAKQHETTPIKKHHKTPQHMYSETKKTIKPRSKRTTIK